MNKAIEPTDFSACILKNMDFAYAIHKIILDQAGKPVDYVFVDANPAFESMTGLRLVDIIGKRVTAVLPGIEQDPADWIGRYGEVALQGNSFHFEQYAKVLNKWYDVSVFSPETHYFVTIFKDVSGSKEMEEKLSSLNRELRERIEGCTLAETRLSMERRRFTDIFEMLPAYLILLTPDYHVSYANRFFRERFGESHGKCCYEYLFNRTEPCVICDTYTVLKTLKPHEWEWVGPDGRNYYIYDFPFTDADGSTLILEMGIDITKQKNAEKQIREQAELLDYAHDAITLRGLDNRILYWNKGSERLYGWNSTEAVGKIAHDLLHKGDLTQPLNALRIVRERGEWSGEMTHRDRNGKDIIVDSRWTLVNDDTGKPESILVINTDITEKKRLETRFLRAQRMESLGTLAGGIAHDLNNILAPIMMSVDLFKLKLKDEESQRLLERIKVNIERGANLVKQILSFARGADVERQSVQIPRLITDVEKTIKETFPRSVEIHVDVPSDIWSITGDTTQLFQVLMNLCVNARDAMDHGGILRISAENMSIDENYARMNIDAKPGPYVVITVVDTGTGMPPEVIDRLFEPFFTTKKQGKGTGLGLSTSLGIVKGHGGFIHVYSEFGKGSKFKVFLPSSTTTVEKVMIDRQMLDVIQGHGELVLVVDDEKLIREITVNALEKNDYKAIVAGDGAEAVAMFAQKSKEIGIVLLDMMMPVMDGYACLKALRRIDPRVRVIGVSGLGQNGKHPDLVSKATRFLVKPFTTRSLLETIRDVLSET